MKAQIVAHGLAREVFTQERCFIRELWNSSEDDALSIARARVEPGATTTLHRLDVDERYLVTAGCGVVEVEGVSATEVGAGDLAVVPAGKSQRIRNTGTEDLVFYCVCSPRFRPSCYHALE